MQTLTQTVAHGLFGGHRRLTGGELRLQRAAENFTRVLLQKAESPLTWSSRDFAVVSTGMGRPCLRALACPQGHAHQRWQRSAAKHGSCACVCTHSRLTSDLWRLCVGEIVDAGVGAVICDEGFQPRPWNQFRSGIAVIGRRALIGRADQCGPEDHGGRGEVQLCHRRPLQLHLQAAA